MENDCEAEYTLYRILLLSKCEKALVAMNTIAQSIDIFGMYHNPEHTGYTKRIKLPVEIEGSRTADLREVSQDEKIEICETLKARGIEKKVSFLKI